MIPKIPTLTAAVGGDVHCDCQFAFDIEDMTDYMEYSYPNEWVESLTENMKAWLSSTWTTLDGEAPEPDFVEYIMVKFLYASIYHLINTK